MAIVWTIVAAVVVFGFAIYAFSSFWAVRERSRIEQTAETWYARFSDEKKKHRFH